MTPAARFVVGALALYGAASLVFHLLNVGILQGVIIALLALAVIGWLVWR